MCRSRYSDEVFRKAGREVHIWWFKQTWDICIGLAVNASITDQSDSDYLIVSTS